MDKHATLPRFQQAQYQFAAHLRNPAHNPAPSDVEDRRTQIYRDLFYNNVEDFLANAFPVLRKISADDVWHARVRDFYARHECHDPLFHRVAAEFLSFLENGRGEHADDPPFLRELCHYEWVELELSVSELTLTPELANPNGDVMAGRPLVSPLAWTLSYEWPVHRIGPDSIPEAPSEQPTYLIVNRNRQDDVRFMEINAVTARLMQLLEEDVTSSGTQLLTQIATELGHPQPQAVVDAGAEILRDLRERDILLGTRR
ncbi:HvfC family RiPP maturation protein [Stenotrophobium rhamnosiphilum]|uniref:DUF2063 domain-containing protein n=1 Tax=Stenotrophobium rhamnosiphilum TaxID=2029166 RepID=A0A2T5MBL6_9GAMM|nr:putative DNA-binding domain-containing protein [Stenotrophobium rhamnosiphilum]PTU29122.1 DUF2063 domain-containing protein [Stenotrophobium rhamnosiphilum]